MHSLSSFVYFLSPVLHFSIIHKQALQRNSHFFNFFLFHTIKIFDLDEAKKGKN